MDIYYIEMLSSDPNTARLPTDPGHSENETKLEKKKDVTTQEKVKKKNIFCFLHEVLHFLGTGVPQ